MCVRVYVNLICETYSTTSEDTSQQYFYHCINVIIYPLVGPHDQPSGSFNTVHYPSLSNFHLHASFHYNRSFLEIRLEILPSVAAKPLFSKRQMPDILSCLYLEPPITVSKFFLAPY